MDIVGLYKAICKEEGLKPLPVKFGKVGKGGAMITYYKNSFKPTHITFDKSRVGDIEFALYHEMAHQICLEKYKYPGHGAKFTKVFNRVNDTYMYSDLAGKYMR